MMDRLNNPSVTPGWPGQTEMVNVRCASRMVAPREFTRGWDDSTA